MTEIMSSSQIEQAEKVDEVQAVHLQKEDVQETAMSPSQDPLAGQEIPLTLPKEQIEPVQGEV